MATHEPNTRARWVHDIALFVRRRIDRLIAEKPVLATAVSKDDDRSQAAKIAEAESDVAYFGLPGNRQGPWDGKHVSCGCKATDCGPCRAAAKRARRASKPGGLGDIALHARRA